MAAGICESMEGYYSFTRRAAEGHTRLKDTICEHKIKGALDLGARATLITLDTLFVTPLFIAAGLVEALYAAILGAAFYGFSYVLQKDDAQALQQRSKLLVKEARDSLLVSLVEVLWSGNNFYSLGKSAWKMLPSWKKEREEEKVVLPDAGKKEV